MLAFGHSNFFFTKMKQQPQIFQRANQMPCQRNRRVKLVKFVIEVSTFFSQICLFHFALAFAFGTAII